MSDCSQNMELKTHNWKEQELQRLKVQKVKLFLWSALKQVSRQTMSNAVYGSLKWTPRVASVAFKKVAQFGSSIRSQLSNSPSNLEVSGKAYRFFKALLLVYTQHLARRGLQHLSIIYLNFSPRVVLAVYNGSIWGHSGQRR